MPVAQLDALVLAVMEAEAKAADDADDADDADEAAEADTEVEIEADTEVEIAADAEVDELIDDFDTQPTACRPVARTSTIDQLIAALKHPEAAHHPPRHRQRRRDPRR